MESFFSLLLTIGFTSPDQDDKYDIVGKLPVEIAIMILRKLDPRTLVSAAKVNKRWLSLIQSDAVLRAAVKRQMRQEILQHIYPEMRVKMIRTAEDSSRPFAYANGIKSTPSVVRGEEISENVPAPGQINHNHRFKKPANQRKLHKTAKKTGKGNAVSQPKRGIRF